MKEGLISIGKMAKMNRISIPTLRLYDERGLLKPRYIDPETGYRYYDINQNARLDVIVYMKELGMSLAEIEQALQKEDITIIEELLAQKNEQLHEQKSPTIGTLSLEYIDRRYIWGIPCSDNFYNSDVHSYEKVLMELRKRLEEEGFPQIHSYNIGTSILQKDFAEGEYIANQIFIFAGRSALERETSFQIVDSGMYACIYLDNYDDEIQGAVMLRDYCMQNKCSMTGDYICEVMTGFHVFDNDPRSMFLRLQIPVTFPK